MLSSPKERVFLISSIVFAMVVNFTIYNLRVIAEYIFQRPFGPFTQPDLARFICYFLFSFLISTKPINFYKNFLVLFLPVFLIDATTLLFGRELIPLRFPFVTLYPLLGICCGIFLRVNRTKFIGYFLGSVIFMILAHYYFVPQILKYMHVKHNITEMRNKPLANSTFMGVDSMPVALFDTLNSKQSIIEFYFVGCRPCAEKLEYLKTFYDEFKEQDINIVLICDGTANTFSQFLTHWKNAKYKNIAFLYDFNRSIPKYEIEGYPTELLTDGKLIIKKEKGFGATIANDWLAKEKLLMHKMLNHAK